MSITHATTPRGFRLPRCSGCRLPLRLCACDELPRLKLKTELVLVLHLFEVGRTSCTGWIAARMLPQAHVLTYRGRDASLVAPTDRPLRNLLLHPQGRPLTAEDRAIPSRLWVPDGTWRQIRRMVQRNELLLGAEAVSVSGPEGSSPAGLRRSQGRDQLSTGEAIARALGALESQEHEKRLRAGLAIVVERALSLRRPSSAICG